MSGLVKTLIPSLGIVAAVIGFISAVLGILTWPISITLTAIGLTSFVVIGKFLLDKRTNNRIPIGLTAVSFAYEFEPNWLSSEKRKKFSDLAKAAFVLLLFEQTETGCWGKSYLPRHLARGETLPKARGAMTGTPFALLAISSYAKSNEGAADKTKVLIQHSTYRVLFETLANLLQSDGTYFRNYKQAYPGRERVPETARHAAGACLIKLLYERFLVPDQKTVEWLCDQPIGKTYDVAVVCRLFLQISHTQTIPLWLRLRVSHRLKKLLKELVRQVQSVTDSNIAHVSDMRHDSINQWSTAWYLLGLISDSTISAAVRAVFTDRLRQFLLAQSATEPTGTSLLPAKIEGLKRVGVGKTVFGTGVALLSWRSLERSAPNDTMQSAQAQRMVDRIITSAADAIEGPMSNPKPRNSRRISRMGSNLSGSSKSWDSPFI